MQERHKLGREKSPVTFSEMTLQLLPAMLGTGCYLSSVFPAKSRPHVALQPCHPEAVPGPCLAPMNAAAWHKGKSRCNSNQVPNQSPRRARADRQLEGDTRDWQMKPVHKNPSFSHGTHLINQPSCLSRSSPSPLLGGELEATKEQRTNNMDFLEHEKEAPIAEMQKKSSVWALIKMAWFPKRGDTPLVNCSCEQEVCKRTRAAKFAKPYTDERWLEPW